jgi:hypothetical protein
LQQAVTQVGTCGLVVLLQPFSALCDVVAHEAALFSEIDYENTSVVRVFMQWNTSLGLKTTYAFLPFRLEQRGCWVALTSASSQ